MYIYYIIALIIIGIDQLSKWIIVKNMELSEQIPVIENFFYITSHRNQGAAWGILQGQMIFFYLITVIVIVGVVYYMQKQLKGHAFQLVAFSFILGGAIGNFIDRLFRKEVVDFLDVKIFSYDFPIFNIADSALVVGVILVILAMYLEEKQKSAVKK